MWPFRRETPPLGAPGSVVAGKYRVEKQLASGGMGVVLVAQHTQLEERVALKLLHAEGQRKPEEIARFLREGRATSKLRSPHVVRILDIGEADDGSPYLAMELLEGHDLGKLLEIRGKLPIAYACDCVIQACEAIAEAHALGIVHRDLKPGNLFVSPTPGGEPSVKVLDFGISKSAIGTDRDLKLTSTQAVFGTPYYMAPELLRAARNADARSDVWALGCILYELTSGHVPFPGTSLPEICARIATDLPEPLAELRPDAPLGFLEAVAGALEKDPNKRTQSALALAEALAPFASPATRNTPARIARVVEEARVRAARAEDASGPNPVVGAVGAPRTLSGIATSDISGSMRGKWAALAGGVAVGAVIAVVAGVWITRSDEHGKATPAAGTTLEKVTGAGDDGTAKDAPKAAASSSTRAATAKPSASTPTASSAKASSTPAAGSKGTKPKPITPGTGKPVSKGPSAVFDDPN